MQCELQLCWCRKHACAEPCRWADCVLASRVSQPNIAAIPLCDEPASRQMRSMVGS